MRTKKSTYVALFAALLFVAGGVTVWAHAPQQTGDQSQNDSSTAKKGKKKAAAPVTAAEVQAQSTTAAPATAPAASAAPATKSSATPAAKPAGPASAPASKTTTSRQAPPANSAGMVWVNTDSGVYHKPGTHWYGKTKQGKYMTEADAQKAGFRAVSGVPPKKQSK